jgi:hypothetical protein
MRLGHIEELEMSRREAIELLRRADKREVEIATPTRSKN